MLKASEAEAIERAIRAAEGKTSAEIVVCLRRASGEDRGVAAFAGLCALVLMFGAIDIIDPALNRDILLAAALGAAVALFLFFDRFDLGLKFLPARMLTGYARRAARAVFLDHGLDATPQRNAVLLFVSRAERYVEILPDRGLAAAVPAQRWANIVSAFQAQAAKQGMVPAVTEAVTAIGAICAGPFPAGARNPDLVPNRPIVG